MQISESYVSRVTMTGYPATLTDASINLSGLLSSDTGIFVCHVQHEIEEQEDTVDVHVQGWQMSKCHTLSHEVVEATGQFIKVHRKMCPIYYFTELKHS